MATADSLNELFIVEGAKIVSEYTGVPLGDIDVKKTGVSEGKNLFCYIIPFNHLVTDHTNARVILDVNQQASNPPLLCTGVRTAKKVMQSLLFQQERPRDMVLGSTSTQAPSHRVLL